MEDVDNVEQTANKQLLQHNLLAGLLPRHPPHCSCARHAIPSCSVLSPLKEQEAKGGGGWPASAPTACLAVMFKP